MQPATLPVSNALVTYRRKSPTLSVIMEIFGRICVILGFQNPKSDIFFQITYEFFTFLRYFERALRGALRGGERCPSRKLFETTI